MYDVLEHDGLTYIVMEYVEGVSLSAHLARGPAAAFEVRAVGRQLGSALPAAHAQGVIHRDLKPANIQVMRDGSISYRYEIALTNTLNRDVATIDPDLDVVDPHP